MKKFITEQAATADLATQKALEELGVGIDAVKVEIVSETSDSAEVKVTLRDNSAERVSVFVNGILKKMNLDCKADVAEKDDTLNIVITGADSGAAIGYRGEALDALQYLVLTFLNQENLNFKKVVVDSENYRGKRAETLHALALRLADKAVRLGKEIALEPMNPFERRAVHSALAESGIASTASEGEEPNRFVVIIPKGVEVTGRIAARESSDRDHGHDHGSNRRNDHRRDDRRRDDRDGRHGEERHNEEKHVEERRGGEERRREYGLDERRGRDFKYNDEKPRKERKFIDDDEVKDGAVHRDFTQKVEEPTETVQPKKQVGPPRFKSFGKF